jgi:hypothetical protein
MAVLRVQTFSGIVPVSGDRALQETFATESQNTWLYGSELRGIRPPIDLIAVQTSTRRVFRVPKRTVGGDPAYPSVVPPPSYLGDSIWMQFTDPDTDIVRGQLTRDQWQRWYFCSPTSGPMFNTYQRMVDGLAAYRLGVPGPPLETTYWSPTITSITGGATPVVTRAYTYTWLNIYGEESAPALPVTGAGNANAVWNIARIQDPSAGIFDAYAPFDKKRLYRTVTGESGETVYYKVADIPAGTTTYADDCNVLTDAIVVNNLILESTSWALPPTTLKGFVAMPNGFLIGFDKNTVYMSESYRFHAWPAEYEQAAEYNIVGLGILGQTCVVCTEGYPSTITGTTPAACSFTKATTGEPCLSRGSIVSTPQGVIYASQNGLMMMGPNGIQNVTEKLITKDEWMRDYAPQYIRGVRYQNGYLALRMPPSPTPRSAFFLDPTSLKVALTELTDFADIVAINVDIWSGEVLPLKIGMIRRWDPPTSDLMPVLWKSKEFQFAFKENFGCYAIYWDDARYSDFNYGTSIMPVTERVRFRVLADRSVVYDQVVPKNGAAVRLPSGFKADIWQFEIRARAPVYSMHVASTVKELRSV